MKTIISGKCVRGISCGILALAFVAGVTGCASNKYDGDNYGRIDARKAFEVMPATILKITPVKIEGTSGVVGGVAGGAVGATGANAVASSAGATGPWRNFWAILFGVGGAGAGAVAEQRLTTIDALEIMVKYPDGRVESIVQGKGNDVFTVGQEVSVLIQGSERRVRP